jgi:hypothetical protein
MAKRIESKSVPDGVQLDIENREALARLQETARLVMRGLVATPLGSDPSRDRRLRHIWETAQLQGR